MYVIYQDTCGVEDKGCLAATSVGVVRGLASSTFTFSMALDCT